MNFFINLSITTMLVLPLVGMADEIVPAEQKEISVIEQMFEKGKVSGELRSVFAGYNQEKPGENSTYATAVGGKLKYELAEVNGFNAAAAFRTSNDLGFATGEKGVKQNSELSSSDGAYTVLSEAYINYKNDGFNLRIGRQIINTPLTDTDDIRMIPNTFEAYMATYKDDSFLLTAGKVLRWQGADAGLDDGWVDNGENGVWLGGITYNGPVGFNAWYYDISKKENATKALYFDIGLDYIINDNIYLHGEVQYLKENEVDGSGVEADIYGAAVNLMAHGVGVNLAYNKSMRVNGKRSFSGIGGGTMYTSMDTMIIDEITEDRDARAVVAGISYEFYYVYVYYIYGDFYGSADGAGNKAHIVEQNIGFEYSIIEDKLKLYASYIKEEDKESLDKTENDWDRLQVSVIYKF